MNEEQFKLKKKKNRNFLVKNAFLPKIQKILDFVFQNSILTLRCTGLQKTKHFWENLILKTKTRVTINVHPLSPPTRISVTANFRGTHTLTHVLKNGYRKDNETFIMYARISFQHQYTRNLKIRLPGES